MQMPQATLLEILPLANKDSSVGSPKLPSQWGCESQTEAVLPSALTECARCQLQHSVSSSTKSSMHRCLLRTCAEAAHKHTDMQASSTSSEAVLRLQHSALSHIPDSYCSRKTTGPSQQPCSHRSIEVETCFPNSSQFPACL